MRVVFLGTGEIGLPALRWLADPPIAGVELVGVVTQPDRAAGRGREIRPGPIKQFAMERGIPVQQPVRLKTPEAVADLEAWKGELFLVVAYGQILSCEVLDLPALGVVNLHASLLPRHRGASPIQAAILAGDKVSGMTVMHVAPELDAGDVILQRSLALDERETGGSLHDRLAELAVPALAEALPLLMENRAPRLPQDPTQVTYAGKLAKEDGYLDWSRPAEELDRRIRAFNPWPGSFTRFPATPPSGEGHLLKVWSARIVPDAEGGVPGVILPSPDEGLRVACGDGVLEILEAQVEGRRRLPVAELRRGLVLPPGMVLG